MRRATIFLTTLAFTMVALMPAALADPKTEPLWLECQGVPSGWITANGNGPWTPAHNLDTTGNYVPYAFEFSVYFTPDGGEETLIEAESSVKQNVPNNAKKHPHGVCTFGESFPVDSPILGTGTGRFEAMAWVFYTGK